MEFDGVNDYVYSSPIEELAGKLQKGRWYLVVHCRGAEDDLVIASDSSVGLFEFLCDVNCPLCGSRRLEVIAEDGGMTIECRVCGAISGV